MGRDNGLGINHFDRNNECKQPDGSAYGRVNWSIDVPNGVYSTVEADFGEELDAWSKLHCTRGIFGDPCAAAPTRTSPAAAPSRPTRGV